MTTESTATIEPKPILTEAEAITEAIDALRERAESFHFDIRAARMMGDHVPLAAKNGAIKQARALEAIRVLRGLNWWQKKAA